RYRAARQAAIGRCAHARKETILPCAHRPYQGRAHRRRERTYTTADTPACCEPQAPMQRPTTTIARRAAAGAAFPLPTTLLSARATRTPPDRTRPARAAADCGHDR